MTSDKVRHKSTPSEPWATEHAYGTITSTPEGHLRVTPAARGIPAMAFVKWGEEGNEFYTWERFNDLTVIRERKR